MSARTRHPFPHHKLTLDTQNWENKTSMPGRREVSSTSLRQKCCTSHQKHILSFLCFNEKNLVHHNQICRTEIKLRKTNHTGDPEDSETMPTHAYPPFAHKYIHPTRSDLAIGKFLFTSRSMRKLIGFSYVKHYRLLHTSTKLGMFPTLCVRTLLQN